MFGNNTLLLRRESGYVQALEHGNDAGFEFLGGQGVRKEEESIGAHAFPQRFIAVETNTGVSELYSVAGGEQFLSRRPLQLASQKLGYHHGNSESRGLIGLKGNACREPRGGNEDAGAAVERCQVLLGSYYV